MAHSISALLPLFTGASPEVQTATSAISNKSVKSTGWDALPELGGFKVATPGIRAADLALNHREIDSDLLEGIQSVNEALRAADLEEAHEVLKPDPLLPQWPDRRCLRFYTQPKDGSFLFKSGPMPGSFDAVGKGRYAICSDPIKNIADFGEGYRLTLDHEVDVGALTPGGVRRFVQGISRMVGDAGTDAAIASLFRDTNPQLAVDGSEFVKFPSIAAPEKGLLHIDTKFHVDEARLKEVYPRLFDYIQQLKGNFELKVRVRTQDNNDLAVMRVASSEKTLTSGMEGEVQMLMDRDGIIARKTGTSTAVQEDRWDFTGEKPLKATFDFKGHASVWGLTIRFSDLRVQLELSGYDNNQSVASFTLKDQTKIEVSGDGSHWGMAADGLIRAGKSFYDPDEDGRNFFSAMARGGATLKIDWSNKKDPANSTVKITGQIPIVDNDFVQTITKKASDRVVPNEEAANQLETLVQGLFTAFITDYQQACITRAKPADCLPNK